MSRIALLSISLSVVMLCPLHANGAPKPGDGECPKELSERLDKMEQQATKLDKRRMEISGRVHRADYRQISIEEMHTFHKRYLCTKNTIEPTENSIELAAPAGQIRYAMEDVE